MFTDMFQHTAGGPTQSMYNHLQDGSCSIPQEYRYNTTFLKRYANQSRSIFRYGGVTYKPNRNRTNMIL